VFRLIKEITETLK